jgi:predicted transcriptional regulator
MAEGRRQSAFPGFKEIAARRSLADDLVSRRVKLGLTQTEVAARMGTSQSAVARFEAGGSDVRLSTIERYAEAIGCSLDWQVKRALPS